MPIEVSWGEGEAPEVTQIPRLLKEAGVVLTEKQTDTMLSIASALKEYYLPSYTPKVRACDVYQKDGGGLMLVLVGVHTNQIDFGEDYLFNIGPFGGLSGRGGRKRLTQALTLQGILNGSL